MEPRVVQLPVGDDPPTGRLYYGVHVLDALRGLPDGCAHVACTSPPYWALRDYQTTPTVWGDGPSCDHDWDDTGSCRCGAWRGALGLEPTPDLYVEHLVEVFREVRRVLRDDGTLWLNLGDSYAHKAQGRGDPDAHTGKHHGTSAGTARNVCDVPPGLKPKDLVGVPWRVALALQADGWWIRNAVIWHKKNHLPHPVKDRLVASYEVVFLLSKSYRYYFDLDAIRVPHTYEEYDEDGSFTPAQQWFELNEGSRKLDQTEGQLGTNAGPPRRLGRGLYNPRGKNPGDVWTLPTHPFPGTHFAVWPPVLPKRCIEAGSSERGVCPSCGSPWARNGGGWEPSCGCGEDPVRAVVLDPFSGSGTTGMVALSLDRDFIGIDLQQNYLDMATARLRGERPPGLPADDDDPVFDLFGE